MTAAHDALMALARGMVEEIAVGRAIELAAAGGATLTVDPVVRKPPPPPEGAQAVHPGLGSHLSVLPGDPISGHAYAHLNLAQPGGQDGPPIAGP
jgi:hypothetical protein